MLHECCASATFDYLRFLFKSTECVSTFLTSLSACKIELHLHRTIVFKFEREISLFVWAVLEFYSENRTEKTVHRDKEQAFLIAAMVNTVFLITYSIEVVPIQQISYLHLSCKGNR